MSTAFVLPEDAVSGAGPVTFPGFPGVWTPGEPIEAQAFVDAGVFASADAMVSRVEELGLPLEPTSVQAGEAPLPNRDNHVPNAPEAAAAAEKVLAAMTHAELDAKATSLGIELPDGTKPEKVAALETAMQPAALEEMGAEHFDEDAA